MVIILEKVAGNFLDIAGQIHRPPASNADIEFARASFHYIRMLMHQLWPQVSCTGLM